MKSGSMSRIIFYRILYFLLNPVRKMYWFIYRPKTRGVKVVVFKDGKVLLVKLAYAHKLWTIPGGGVKRNETFGQAASREILEETGITLAKVTKIGQYFVQKEYKQDTVEVFYSETDVSEFKVDPVEIQDVGWFDIDNLPTERTKKVDELLLLARKNKF